MPHPRLSEIGRVMKEQRLVSRPVEKALRYKIERSDGSTRYLSPARGGAGGNGYSKKYIGARCPEEGILRPCVKHPERHYLVCQQCWCCFWPDGRIAELPPPASFTMPWSEQERVKSAAAKGNVPFRGSKWKDEADEDEE